jgi:hypothetical protein
MSADNPQKKVVKIDGVDWADYDETPKELSERLKRLEQAEQTLEQAQQRAKQAQQRAKQAQQRTQERAQQQAQSNKKKQEKPQIKSPPNEFIFVDFINYITKRKLTNSTECIKYIKTNKINGMEKFHGIDRDIFYNNILNSIYDERLDNLGFYEYYYFIKDNKIFNIINIEITSNIDKRVKDHILKTKITNPKKYYVFEWFENEKVFLKNLIKTEISEKKYDIIELFNNKINDKEKKEFYFLYEFYKENIPNLVFKFYFYKFIIREYKDDTNLKGYTEFARKNEKYSDLMINYFIKDYYDILIPNNHFLLFLKIKPANLHLEILKTIFSNIDPNSLVTIFKPPVKDMGEKLFLYKSKLPEAEKYVSIKYPSSVYSVMIPRYYLYFTYLLLFLNKQTLNIDDIEDAKFKLLYFYYNKTYNSMKTRETLNLPYSKPYGTLDELQPKTKSVAKKNKITIYI